MNILILGGAGFLGSNLVRRCLKEPGNKILVIDSLDSRLKSSTDSLKEILPQIEFIKGDIRDEALMKKAVQHKDVIFNCAGQTSHPLSLLDPFFDVEVNCVGNLILLESVKKYNKKALVIYTSSSTVIGRTKGEVVDETHGEFPLDIYSANKGVAEKYFRIYNRIYDLNTLSIRFANLYGAYGKAYPEFGFINYFISLVRQDKKIKIYGEGKQKRNVMYVEDASNLLYQCIFHKEIFGEVYFAGHLECHSVMDIAKEIVSIFGKGSIEKIEWPDMRKRIEIENVLISADKLYNAIKYKQKYSLREGLKRTKDILDNKRPLS